MPSKSVEQGFSWLQGTVTAGLYKHLNKVGEGIKPLGLEAQDVLRAER